MVCHSKVRVKKMSQYEGKCQKNTIKLLYVHTVSGWNGWKTCQCDCCLVFLSLHQETHRLHYKKAVIFVVIGPRLHEDLEGPRLKIIRNTESFNKNTVTFHDDIEKQTFTRLGSNTSCTWSDLDRSDYIDSRRK